MEIEIIQMIFLFFKTCAMFIKTLYFFDRKKSFDVLNYKFNGPSPSGKASGFGLDIPRFES